MATRTELHDLVDQLPDRELAAARRLLEYLRDSPADPLEHLLLEAPEDDEPLTPEDVAAIEEGRAAYRRGAFLTDEQLKRELGL